MCFYYLAVCAFAIAFEWCVQSLLEIGGFCEARSCNGAFSDGKQWICADLLVMVRVSHGIV